MIVRFIRDANETIRACTALAADLRRPARAQLFSTGPAAGVAVPKRVLSDDEDRTLREIVRAASPDQGANLAREAAIVARVT